MATIASQYPDFEQKEMNGEKCSFCKEPATGIATRYTIYARKDELIPFCDPQKHEFAVCAKHSKGGGLFDPVYMAAFNKRSLSRIPPSKPYFADFKEVRAITPDIYEKIKPVVLDFNPIISESEIKTALTTPPNQTSLLDVYELSEKRETAKKGMVKWFIILPVAGLILLAFGFVYNFWIALCAGAVALTIAPISIFFRYRQIGQPPQQRNAQEVVNSFYREVQGGSGDIPAESALLAFQLLSPTVAKRDNANSLNNLTKVWNEIATVINKTLNEISDNSAGASERISGSRKDVTINVSPLTESSAEVVSEFWHFREKGQVDSISGKHIAWVITRFHNIVVKIGDKWFLMAGDPGEISSSR